MQLIEQSDFEHFDFPGRPTYMYYQVYDIISGVFRDDAIQAMASSLGAEGAPTHVVRQLCSMAS